MLKRILLVVIAALAAVPVSRAQFADCSIGLLQMPTAEMPEDGTFIITNNFLNKHSLAPKWGYNTFQYGVSVSYWGRIEIGYVCTILNGAWDPTPEEEKTYRQTIVRNQDRHFTGRISLLREGEFGLKWMPAVAIGVSDPMSGSGSIFTRINKVAGVNNGYFNRYFIVLTKHFSSLYGEVGIHAGYQVNLRIDYPINAPCIGVNWQPKWLQQKGIMDRLDVIAEYDSRTINIGVIASIWDNRFEAMFELQSLQWVNFGLRYKLKLKKN